MDSNTKLTLIGVSKEDQEKIQSYIDNKFNNVWKKINELTDIQTKKRRFNGVVRNKSKKRKKGIGYYKRDGTVARMSNKQLVLTILQNSDVPLSNKKIGNVIRGMNIGINIDTPSLGSIISTLEGNNQISKITNKKPNEWSFGLPGVVKSVDVCNQEY